MAHSELDQTANDSTKTNQNEENNTNIAIASLPNIYSHIEPLPDTDTDIAKGDVNVQLENHEKKQEYHQKEQAITFDAYLDKYIAEHNKKYIAPHVKRRLQQEFDHNTKGKCNQSYCVECRKQQQHSLDIERNKTIKPAQEHQKDTVIIESKEDLFSRQFYSKHSKYFTEWQDMRNSGWDNEHLEKFYNNKHKFQSKTSRSEYKNIESLFHRFYRYAIDIDNLCHYKQDLINQLLSNKENVYFLDIGFAPGGMSRYLLDAHRRICGVGITLPSFDRGNVFIKELLSDPRFICRERDILDLCKKITTPFHFYSLLSGFGDHGFDLVIVGITCHQDFHSDHRLDHEILLNELYLTFLTLNNGGSVLIRHKIEFECFHQHILYIFLKCFSDRKVGKPLTEFAKNKTFWILWKGFDKSKCRELKLVENLRKLIRSYDGSAPPYGKNPKTGQYYNPKMIDKSMQQIIEEKKDEFIAVMDHVFEIQMKSLRSYCIGKKDQLCKFGKDCNRYCNRAHSKDECIDGFYEAIANVDSVMYEQVLSNKHHSRILTLLETTQTRNRKKKINHRNNIDSNWRNND